MKFFSPSEQRALLVVTACFLLLSAVAWLRQEQGVTLPTTAGGAGGKIRGTGHPRLSFRTDAAGDVKPVRQTGRLNPNFATLDELCSVPGIGRSLAGRILAFREHNLIFGPEDMLRIRGIGKRNWSRMAPFFTFSTGPSTARTGGRATREQVPVSGER